MAVTMSRNDDYASNSNSNNNNNIYNNIKIVVIAIVIMVVMMLEVWTNTVHDKTILLVMRRKKRD